MSTDTQVSGNPEVSQLPASQLTSCGDMSCEFLINPIPRPTPPRMAINLKPRARRVTFIDNRKPNSLQILSRAQEMLRERGIEVNEKIYDKYIIAERIADEIFEKVSNEEGLVLSGVNDCGSCSMGGCLDSIALQQAGVAGFVILTQPFASQIDRSMAYQPSDRELPAVVINHPTQNVSDDELEQRALTIADTAEAILDGKWA